MNLVSQIPAEKQELIAQEVISDADKDDKDRAGWKTNRDKWYKLWANDRDKKSWPNGSPRSNVNIPILAIACSQYSGRTFSSIFGAPDMVKAVPVGPEDERSAGHIAKFLNWQLQHDMEEYEEVFDKVLQLLPINGIAFKKVYWDTENDRPKTENVGPLDLILPYGTKSIETALRITHVLRLYYPELQDRNDAGLYENFDKVSEKPGEKQETEMQATADKLSGITPSEGSAPHIIYECHKKYDLGDGKRQPLIFTVDKDSETLLRCVSREIGGKTIHNFIDYHFIPNPGGYYSFGFGQMLEQLNEMANTAFNQIFDSGKLANMPPTVYSKKAGIAKRKIQVSPGASLEAKDVKQLVTLPIRGVDQTLFQVLGYINEYVQTFTSVTDLITGKESKGVKTPTKGGTEAIIDQGLVSFGVMSKRVFRSHKKELRLIMGLNRAFMTEKKQYRVMGDNDKIAFPEIKRKQFDQVFDVVPTADPVYASRQVKRQEAAEIYTMGMQNPLIVGNPELQIKPNMQSMWVLTNNLLNTYQVQNKSAILPEMPDLPIPAPQENAMFMQGDYVEPKNGENHEEHLALHNDWMQTEFFRAAPKDYQELLVNHVNKTMEVAKIDMQMQQMQQQQMAQQAQQQQMQEQQGGQQMPPQGMATQ